MFSPVRSAINSDRLGLGLGLELGFELGLGLGLELGLGFGLGLGLGLSSLNVSDCVKTLGIGRVRRRRIRELKDSCHDLLGLGLGLEVEVGLELRLEVGLVVFLTSGRMNNALATQRKEVTVRCKRGSFKSIPIRVRVKVRVIVRVKVRVIVRVRVRVIVRVRVRVRD
jgi:hypothetical protein